jgi:hypothetical protein
MSKPIAIPAVSVTYAQDGTSTCPNSACAPCKNAPTKSAVSRIS